MSDRGRSNAGPATSLFGKPLAEATPVAGQVASFNGTSWTPASSGLAFASASTLNGFRLTTESGVPVSTSSRAAQGTIYLTPYRHNKISLYNTTDAVWIERSTAEVSLALAGLTAGKNYDVYAYWTGAAVALELSAAWTNDTTRADALTTQDGVRVKSANKSRRLVGTIRASGAATTEDSASQSFVDNEDNEVPRLTTQQDATASWSVGGATTPRGLNAGDGDWKHEFVFGKTRSVKAFVRVYNYTGNPGGGGSVRVGLGFDTASAMSANASVDQDDSSDSQSMGSLGGTVFAEGYHYVQGLEDNNNASAVTLGSGGYGLFMCERQG